MTTKYTARFDHIIKASDIVKAGKLDISEASRNELRQYVPSVNYERSQDLQGLAFDVALVNVFNLNDDGISSEGALKMAPTLTHKPINVEHDRNTIIGHILNGGFSDTVFKKELYYEDVKDTLIPFNITLGGVLYKIVAKDLAEVLLNIQEGKESEFVIASSWEVGFDSFLPAIGGKLLSECRIVTDENEIMAVSPYMKCFGGKGVLPSGERIRRLIDPNGTVVFLGAGLTKYPAADVGAVYVFDYDPSKDLAVPAEPSAAEEQKENESISHLDNKDVISLRTEKNTMEKQEIVKLIEEAVASVKDLSKESLANTTSKIADAIVESNKVFVAEKEAALVKASEAEAKAAKQAEKIAEIEKKITDTSAALELANEKLQKVENDAKAAIAKEKFNERMSALDNQFQMEDSDREIIAKQVSAITTDEEFSDFEKSLLVLMSAKLKSKIQEAEASVGQKIKDAVAEELKKRGITDTLEAKASDTEKIDLPNNSAQASAKEPSVREKFSKAFNKKQIKVTI